VTIDEYGGARQEAGVHAHTFAGVDLQKDKAFPALAGSVDFRAETTQESCLELQYILHVHAHNEGLGSGDVTVDQENILKLIPRGRHNAGAHVDVGRIKEVEDGEMLYFEHLVHTLEAQTPFAIKEIGDVSLLVAGLRSQTEAS